MLSHACGETKRLVSRVYAELLFAHYSATQYQSSSTGDSKGVTVIDEQDVECRVF